jgi:hypothetical protein
MADAGDGGAQPASGAAGPSNSQPRFEDVVGSFKGILQTHEVQVLGTMGLLIGYICIFFAKILAFTNIYMGVLGVGGVTLLLVILDSNFRWQDYKCWVRSIVVIVICLLITAPQLYFAWTVSVSEVRSTIEEQSQREAEARAKQQISPSVTVTTQKSDGSK